MTSISAQCVVRSSAKFVGSIIAGSADGLCATNAAMKRCGFLKLFHAPELVHNYEVHFTPEFTAPCAYS